MIQGGVEFVWAAYLVTYGLLLGYGVRLWSAYRRERAWIAESQGHRQHASEQKV